MKKIKYQIIACIACVSFLFLSCGAIKEVTNFPDVDFSTDIVFSFFDIFKKSDTQAIYNKNDFFQVCAFGTARQVKSMLRKSPTAVNETDRNGFTPIFYAALGENPELYQDGIYLLLNEPEVEERHKILDSLPSANGNKATMKVLLQNGANTKLKNHEDDNVLSYAASFCSNPDILRMLINYGADVNEADEDGRTPIMHSLFNKNPQIMEELIKNGAVISQKDYIGADVFIWAVTLRKTNIAKLLIDKFGYQFDFATLKTVIEYINSPKELAIAIDLWQDVNFRDTNGETPLGFAVAKDNVEGVKILLSKNANIDMRYGNSQTELIRAVNKANPNLEIVKLLVGAGADVNAKTKEGSTVLIHAVNKNHSADVARFLINAGADVSAKYDESYVYEYCNSYIKNTSLYTELRNAVQRNSWWW